MLKGETLSFEAPTNLSVSLLCNWPPADHATLLWAGCTSWQSVHGLAAQAGQVRMGLEVE